MKDSYQWLENLDSAESLAWVQSQNQKTLQDWARSERFERFRSKALDILSDKSKLTVGAVFDGWVYHLWKDVKNPFGLWRRARLENLHGQPQWEVLLNLDELSQQRGQATFLNNWSFLKGSPRVLLSLSPDGKDACEILEWDLQTREFIDDGFQRELRKDQMVWISQDEVLWASADVPTHCGYTTEIYFWKRNEPPRLLMKVPTTSMSVWGACLQDSEDSPIPMVVHNEKWDEKKIYYLKDGDLYPTGLSPYSWIYDIYQDRVVVWIERAWGNFPAGSALISKVPGKWHDFQPEDFEFVFKPDQQTVFQDLTATDRGILLSTTRQLKSQLSLWTLENVRSLETPEGSTVSAVFSGRDSDHLFALFQSFSHPPAWVEWTGNEWKTIQETKPLFQTENLNSKQEWAISADGTKIPYWLVFDSRTKFPAPTLQYGYGGFALSMLPEHNPLIGSLWLERGGVYILAQIRGGGEFGPAWHEAAKLQNKQKSYDDFIAVSEDVIRKGYTTSSQLAIRGRSNGGLLVGATITQRPDLYGAAVIEVPLLDMIRYVELPPGSSWKEEYGDPKDPQFREIILKYSPYQNIEKHSKYPPILIRTARSDDRVHPGHARKMAAKMQSLGHSVWFFEEELGGHGSTPVKDQAFQMALVYEFLWTNLAPQNS